MKKQISVGFEQNKLERLIKVLRGVSMDKSAFIRYATMKYVREIEDK